MGVQNRFPWHLSQRTDNPLVPMKGPNSMLCFELRGGEVDLDRHAVHERSKKN